MSLFADDLVVHSSPRRVRRRGHTAGWIALAVAFLLLGVLALAPSPYVVQQPGPVFDTLGTVPVG